MSTGRLAELVSRSALFPAATLNRSGSANPRSLNNALPDGNGGMTSQWLYLPLGGWLPLPGFWPRTFTSVPVSTKIGVKRIQRRHDATGHRLGDGNGGEVRIRSRDGGED